MIKRPTLRKLIIIAALLLAAGLESCIGLHTGRCTIINLGGAVDNIGKQTHHLRQEPCTASIGDTPFPTEALRYQVWKKESTYYVLLPLAYLPADETVFLHSCGFHCPCDGRETLEYSYPRKVTEQEIQLAPLENHIAILTEAQYADACKWRKFDFGLFGNGTKLAGQSHKVLPMSEVDLTGAEMILDCPPTTADIKRPQLSRVAREAPARRTWYNYTLMPLSWAAEVIDIPLTLIATPIGWLVDAIYEPLAN